MYGTPSMRSTFTICACEPTISAGFVARSLSSCSISCTSLRSPSWLCVAWVGVVGRVVGEDDHVARWSASEAALLQRVAAAAGAGRAGAAERAARRSSSRMTRTPLWSNVRKGRRRRPTRAFRLSVP